MGERPPLRRDPLVPDLVTAVAGGYGWQRLRIDAVSGVTVAIVALPLSMAIAIASGLPPERGLFAAIVGGFLVSLLGGSRHQIGGPAGAFIVLVAAILDRHGSDGLLLATLLAGVIMMAAGLLRLGSYVRLVPAAVIIGFTAGIGIIILTSQLKELLGLTVVKEPSAFWPKVQALWAAAASFKPMALAVSVATIALILALRRWRPAWPALLIAIVAASLATAAAGLEIATIASRFGGIPRSLPAPVIPDITIDKLWRVLPDAIAVALLGSIESLLSAVVADKMSGLRHRSDIELVAQGFANGATAIFGGMPVTGTIARTATNVRSGATSPVAGMLHAVVVLFVMVVAAGLAAYVPLAALGALLALTAWSMIEHKEIGHMLRVAPADALVAVVTTFITVVFDLLSGIAVGCLLAALLGALARKRSLKS
jgi:sulfate permease, SulP family